MAISLTATPVGTPADIIATIATAGGQRMDEVGRYVAELYRLAPLATLNADALVSQWSEETGKGTSAAWRDRLNGAGIGITGPLGGGGTDYGYSFASGTDFARCHCVHMAAYVFGACPEALKPYQSLDPRWQAVFDAGYAGTAKTVDDLSNRWADDPDYGAKIAQHYQWLFGALPAANGDTSVTSPQGTGGATVAFKKYRFVGLDKDVWLPDDIEVIIDIVPDSMIGWVRSGNTFTGQTMLTYHETGNTNPGANALGERNYLHGGPRDDYGNKYQVGYNFAVDDKRLIQLTPLDEDTWAGGNAQSNHVSWHIEQCVGGGLDLDRARRNAAALHGGLCAARGIDPETGDVQHNWWWGKNCPEIIRREGRWPAVIGQIKSFKAQALAAAAGNPQPAPVDPWPYPAPVAPRWWADVQAGKPYIDDAGTIWFPANNLYKVVRATPRQRYAANDKNYVGPDLQAGDTFRSGAIGTARSGGQWVITPMFTRVSMDALQFLPDNEGQAA